MGMGVEATSLLGWPGKSPGPEERVASGRWSPQDPMGMVPWGQSQAETPFRFLGKKSRGVGHGGRTCPPHLRVEDA